MKQEQVGIIQAINGKYVAIDKNGKVRILKKGDIVYEGEELRYEGKVIKNIADTQSTLEQGEIFGEILDANDPYLILQHLKTGDTYLLSHTGYLYLSTDVSGSDNTSSTTTKTTKNTFADNESQVAGGRSQAAEFFGVPVENIIKDGSFTLSEELTPLQTINEKLDTTQEESIERVQTQEISQKTTEEIIKEDNKDEDDKITIKPNDAPTIQDGDFTGKVKELPDLDPNENISKVTTNGKINFNDLDTTDTHTVTFTPKETNYKGDFTAKVENGQIVWDFSVDDKDLDTLKEGETLTQTYTLTLDDGNGGTVTKDVVVTIEGTNDAPIAKPDTATTNEDTPITGNVLNNDTDIDGDTLSVKEVNGNPINTPISTTYGSIVMSEDGSYTFTPDNTNEAIKALSGTQTLDDTITYTVDDGNGGTATQTLTITIAGKNDAPTIQDGDFTGKVKELPDLDPNENISKVTTNGKINFNDLDTTDTHTVTFTPKETNYKGDFTAKVENGQIVWDFSVDDKDLDTLKEGETLTQTYTLTLDDGNGGTVTKDVVVTIEGTNDAPIATNDKFTTDEDTTLTGNVLSNDTDIDGDTLHVSKFTIDGISGDQEVGKEIDIPNRGKLTLNADGSFTFIPALNYHGSAPRVTYTIEDGNGGSDTALLDITVGSVNDDPIANNDTHTINEDEIAQGNLLANDTDVDNNPLHVTKFTIEGMSGEFSPGEQSVEVVKDGKVVGKITIKEDGNYEFEPAKDYDEDIPPITYHISDGHGGESFANLNITITPINDAPVAKPDTKTILEDTKAQGNVLENDFDVDGDTLEVKSAKADINGDGIQEDIPIGEAIAFTDENGKAIGVFKINTHGAYIFNPASDYDGEVPQVSYTISDGALTSSSTLDITITPVEEPPVANKDIKTTKEDTPLNGNVLLNDTDPDGDTLSVQGAKVDINGDGTLQNLPLGTLTQLSKDGVAIGAITLNQDGTFTFTPATNYNGEVPTINYTAQDTTGKTSSSTLNINIDDVNDAPLAKLDKKTVIEDTKTFGNVLLNDVDVDGDTLHVKSAKVDINGDGIKEDIPIGEAVAITKADGSAIGVFKLNADGSYSFDPAPDYDKAIPIIDYTATDGEFDTSSTLTLHISSVNDAPVALPDKQTINEDTQAIGNVLNNDTDTENDTLEVKSAKVDINGDGNLQDLPIGTKTTLSKDGKPIGEITLGANGSYIFTPVADYDGEVPVISYTATDGNSDTSSTLTIKIVGTNDGVSLSGLSADTTPKHTLSEANLPSGSSSDTSKTTQNGTFSFTTKDGLGKVTINGKDISLSTLQNLPSTNQTIETEYGKITLTKYIGDKQGGTIHYTYTLTKNVDNITKEGATNTEYIEKIAIKVTDTDIDQATSTLDIKILDDTPTANPDTNQITEDESPNTVSANVLTNDTQGADGAKVSGVKTGDDIGAEATSNVATNLNGTYGAIHVKEDGSYTYKLDNTNLAVQNLTTGENLTDTFTYTIKDSDGDTSTTTLTITINGANDGVTLANLSENLTPKHTVSEANLDNGSSPNASLLSKVGTFSFVGNDGLGAVTIHGTKLTLADLNALENTNKTITTNYGELTLTKFTGDHQGGAISYTYVLTKKVDNSTQAENVTDTHYIEKIAIHVEDRDGDKASSTLDIKIIDDTPTAQENTTPLSIEEGGEIYTSTEDTNLLKNDILGADGATVTSITYKDENGVSATGNVTQDDSFTIFDTQHGSLHVKKDGSWKFTSDSSVDNTTNPATETFTYTITDGDGDTSSANQSIKITDTNPTANPTSGSVDEGDLSSGSHDTKASTTITKPLNITKNHDDISDVVFTNATITTLNALNLKSGGTALAYTLSNSNHTLTAKAGSESVFTVELLNPSTADGSNQAYKFTLLKPIDHPIGNDQNTQELTFKFDLKDTDSTVANQTFKVSIVDDVPTASSEPALTVVEGQVALTGMVNLLDNDAKGADGLKEANKIAGFKYKDINGEEQTGTLGSEVNTKYGKLTVNADGTWSYTSNQSNVHNTTDTNYNATDDTLADTFTYIIEDYDGDKSEATQTIYVKDGANPTIDNAKNTLVKVYEGDSKVIFDGTSNYNESESNADKGTTSKLTHKLDFTQGTDKAGITSFTFDGTTKTIAEDGSATITSATKGTLAVHYDGKWEYTPPETYEHEPIQGINHENIKFTYKVTDIDGDTASDGEQTIQLDDTLAKLTAIDQSTLEEKFLPTGTAPDPTKVTATGGVIGIDTSNLNGTYDIKFNTKQTLPSELSSLSKKVSYKVSDDGHTLVLYVGDDPNDNTKHVMEVTIQDPTSQTSQNPTYSAKLIEAFDHKTALLDPANDHNLKLDFDVEIHDDDGDKNGKKLTINIIDDFIQNSTQTLVTNEDTTQTITTNADATQDNTTITENGTYGTAEITNDGRLQYTPNKNYSGTDTLKYTTTLDDGITKQTVTVNVDVMPLAENELKTDVNGDNTADLTLDGSVGSHTDNTSVTTYKLATVYNDEDTIAYLKIPNPSKLLLDTSTAKDKGGIESVTEVTISGIPIGAFVHYEDKNNLKHNIKITSSDPTVTIALDTIDTGATDNYLEYTISYLPEHSNEDFTVKYSFTVADTATISSGDVSDTQKFEITQLVDMLGVAYVKVDKLVLTPKTADENTDILLSSIISKEGFFLDNDGSETHTFKISGLPLDVTASIGSLETVTNSGESTKTLTITEDQLETATIKFPHSDGEFKITVTAIAQEDDHEDTKGANPKKKDTDDHATFEPNPGYSEVSKTVTLTIKPDAKDTVFNVMDKVTPEDTAIGLAIDFTNPDNQVAITNGNTVGTAESVTEVTISGIPSGVKLYKTDGTTEVSFNGTSHTFTVGDGTEGTYTLADIKGLKILPPAHSSKDFTLTLSATVKEGTATNTITKEQTIKVTPVAEVISTPMSDTDGNGTPDLTMAGGHTFTSTSFKEDEFFLIGEENAFKLGEGWNNEDSSEQTFAHLTFGMGDTFKPIPGATFKYKDGASDIEVVDSGKGVDIPVAYLNSLHVKPPQDKSGNFKIKVEAKTVDYDEDTNVPVEAISGEAYLSFSVVGVPDDVTLSVVPASGDEDAGRSKGNTSNDPEVASKIDEAEKGITLGISATSSDTDEDAEGGAETVTVTIDKIPDGASLYIWNGAKYVLVDKTTNPNPTNATITDHTDHTDNTWKIELSNYDNDNPPKLIPPHNSDKDFRLKVSAVSFEGGIKGTPTKTFWLPVKIKEVADYLKDNELNEAKATDDSGVENPYNYVNNEAILDSKGNKFLLKEVFKTPQKISSYDDDGSEVETFKITGLQDGFGVEGAAFLGGVGKERAWVVGLADLKANDKVYVKTPEHFSGEFKFQIVQVSTELKGNSKTELITDITALITPDVDAKLTNLQAIQEEDVWKELSFTFTTPDNDGSETRESGLKDISINLADLTSAGAKLRVNGEVVSETADFHKIVTPNGDIPKIEVLNKPNSDKDYSFGIKYIVTDTVKDTAGKTYSNTQTKEAIYKVIVNAVTETTDTLVLDNNNLALHVKDKDSNTNNDIIITNDNVNEAFTKTITLTSSDIDGSEKFIRFEVLNVPDGISVEGGVYVSGGTWYVDVDPTKPIKTSSGVTYDINFTPNGHFDNTPEQDITIKAYIQDNLSSDGENTPAKEEFASATFKIEVTLTGGGGEDPATIKEFSKTAIPKGDEDGSFKLSDFIKAELQGDSKFSVKISADSLPVGVMIEGAMKIGDFWIVDGHGGTSALQTALNSVIVKPPKDFNTYDTANLMNFDLLLTTYGTNGKSNKQEINDFDATITPKTDHMDFHGKTTSLEATDEDVETKISIDLTNTIDGNANTTIIDGKVYLKVSGGDVANGKIEYGGAEISKTAISGVSGLTDGEYYVLNVQDTAPAPNNLDFFFTPAENQDGDVQFDIYTINQESGASDTVLSSGTYTLHVNPKGDSVIISGTENVSGDEDTFIQINYTAQITDPSEKITSIIVNNIPNNYLIYFGEPDSQGEFPSTQLAQNIGGAWSIPLTAPLSNTDTPPKIWLKPPENKSEVIEKVTIKTISDGNFETISDPFSITITPKADYMVINPSDSLGDEYSWTNLNLNAAFVDIDGSETVTLTLKADDTSQALDSSALFKVDGKYYNATFSNGTYTLEDIPSGYINGVKILYHDYDGTLKVTAQNKDGDDIGGKHTADMKLILKDSFNIDVSTETKDMTIFAEDLTIPIAGSLTKHDTIVFNPKQGASANVSLDFKDIADDIRNVETIDIKIGNVALTKITSQQVISMTDNKKLKIDGDGADSITLENGWTKGSSDGGYTSYSKGSATLEIDNDITNVTIL